MGSIFKAVGSLLGITSAPKVSDAASTTLKAAQVKANQGRSALYETSGGDAGQELSPDQVKQRQTLLGN